MRNFNLVIVIAALVALPVGMALGFMRPVEKIIPAEPAETEKEIILLHEVRKGETVWEIAQYYGTTEERILKMNSIENPQKIYPGQRFKIPTGLLWGEIIFHPVKKGESVWKISQLYGAYPYQVIQDNNLDSKGLIKPRQILKVAKVVLPEKKIVASWYGEEFHEKTAANGEKFDMFKVSAAHRVLPLGMRIEVSCQKGIFIPILKIFIPEIKLRNKIVLEITDRGPYILDRQLDLSFKAAKKLGGNWMYVKGLLEVTINSIE